MNEQDWVRRPGQPGQGGCLCRACCLQGFPVTKYIHWLDTAQSQPASQPRPGFRPPHDRHLGDHRYQKKDEEKEKQARRESRKSARLGLGDFCATGITTMANLLEHHPWYRVWFALRMLTLTDDNSTAYLACPTTYTACLTRAGVPTCRTIFFSWPLAVSFG